MHDIIYRQVLMHSHGSENDVHVNKLDVLKWWDPRSCQTQLQVTVPITRTEPSRRVSGCGTGPTCEMLPIRWKTGFYSNHISYLSFAVTQWDMSGLEAKGLIPNDLTVSKSDNMALEFADSNESQTVRFLDTSHKYQKVIIQHFWYYPFSEGRESQTPTNQGFDSQTHHISIKMG